MKVQELIETLEDCDPEAEVYVMSQQNYPFEHSLVGVAVRGDWLEEVEEEPEDAEPVRTQWDRWTAPDAQLPRTDVFLLEGDQIRYGTRKAWESRRD